MASSLAWSLAVCYTLLVSRAVSFIEPGISPLQGKHIKIDIAAVADYSLFSWFTEKARSYPGKDLPHLVAEEVKLYMAGNIRAASNLYRKVDLGLNATIDLLVHSTSVIQTPDEDPQLLHLKRADGTVDAKEMLTIVTAYKQKVASAVDILVLFTKLELSQNGNDGVRGIAQMNALCQPHAAAVVEFDNFHTQFHVAHEVAHVFGVSHDGPTCMNGAIMSSSTKETKTVEDYRFSTCSQSVMAEHLGQASQKYPACMFETLPQQPNTPLLSEFPGSEISVDKQCQMVNGPLSYFCRGRMTGDQICGENLMPCTPMTNYTCTTIRVFPLPGTPCDVDKWCHEGKCVEDPGTPKRECPFGDQSVRVDYEHVLEPCESIISKHPFYCYPFEAECCQTCSKLKTNNSACMYGDAMPGCDQSLCGTLYYTEQYNVLCCKTCSI